MYDILKNVISAGGYKLATVQHKIKKLYVFGDLTEGQTEELLAMASSKASAEAERPEVMKMLRSLADRVAALEAAQSPGEDGAQTPVWKPWDGISQDYPQGAVVTHNGKLWRSVFAGQNVWEPGAVGTESLWVPCEESGEHV